MVKAVMLVAWLTAVFSVTACSEFSTPPSGPSELDGGNQQGYLGVYPDEVDFIQWAKSDSSISGNLQILSVDDADSSQVQSENLSFSGTLSGEDVSLTFPALGTSTTWTGNLEGETLTLTIPGESGTLDTTQMEAASVSDYNEAAREFRRSIEQQAEQEYSTPYSPCPYGLMPINGDDGIDCVSEGGRLESTESQQTTVEETKQESSEQPASENAAVESTIRDHYGAIGAGDFQSAYTYFGPAFRSKEPEETWVNSEQSYDITNSTINSLQVTSVSGDAATATVDVSFEDNTGTPRFLITWSLVKEGGRWKLNDLLSSKKTS